MINLWFVLFYFLIIVIKMQMSQPKRRPHMHIPPILYSLDVDLLTKRFYLAIISANPFP